MGSPDCLDRNERIAWRDARIALLEKALAELSEASEAFIGFNRTPQGCAGWVLDKVVTAKRVLNGGT